MPDRIDEAFEAAMATCRVPEEYRQQMKWAFRAGWFAHGKELDWTTEVPTEPGWYWVRWANSRFEEIVECADGYAKTPHLSGINDVLLRHFSHFAGPIPKPSKEED